MKGRNVSMEVKKGIRNSVILLTLSYASETCMWNVTQQPIQAMETSYLRSACGVSKWDGESNESVCETFSMGMTAEEVDCGVVEWVKCGTLRWFGYVPRVNEYHFVKRKYHQVC